MLLYMDDLIIKKKRGAVGVVFALSLLMLGASIYCMLLPAFNSYDRNLEYFFYAAGVTGIIYFGYLAINQLITLISPGNAVVLTEDGFYDFTLSGGGAGFITWEAVTGTKLYGSKKGKFIGINILKPKKLFKNVKKKTYNEIISNIESEMPPIVIDCRGIEMTPEELAESINEYQRSYNKKINTEAKKNEAAEFDVRRRGSATLEDEKGFSEKTTVVKKHSTLTNPGTETQNLISSPETSVNNGNDEIADILRSLEINKDDKKDNSGEEVKDKKEKTEEEKETKKEEKTITDYRDFGLLFPSDDDDE